MPMPTIAPRAAALTMLLLLVGAGAATAKVRPKATAVSAGGAHTCALLSNGIVKCWGNNGKGQLGDGTRTRRLTAVAVRGLAGATGVSAGGAATCAALADGTARCWGSNQYGQLGDGTKTNRSTPVTVPGLTGVASVSAGPINACAVRVDHTVACWGDNARGQLGNGTRVASSTPITVPGLTDITAVAVDDLHTCALHADGTVSCWGWSGALGPVEDAGDMLTPTLVAGLTDAISSLSGGPYNACALTARGVPACWRSPAAAKVVHGFTNVKAFTFSEDGQQTDHSCAVIAGGTVKCQSPYPAWGQTGIGLTLSKKVVTVPGVRHATAISAGGFYTCAVAAGAVKCWGSNEQGQLGDGTRRSRFRPVQVRGIDKPASGKATVDVFAGYWGGHERSLRITRKGRGKMVVYLGCCTHIINLSFQVFHVRGTYSTARARARVTHVHVFTKPDAVTDFPHVGEVGTLKLKAGVIVESFLGGYYCDDGRMQESYCGA